ncbi:hypothetical protein J7I86_15030, partial [Arthrobacter sp. ISL-95]|nr:hypothetical protein [Arthrobacter sp. ISL-95]
TPEMMRAIRFAGPVAPNGQRRGSPQSPVRPRGIACLVGALSGDWTIPDLPPLTIPTGIRPTSYFGEAKDLPAAALAKYLRGI